ncbi:MAG TPA: GTP cyclohydrolase [Flavobacteriaceae bacterium]|nr:GTP cyclohydrolase [Flavobacteriaceae bacterium]
MVTLKEVSTKKDLKRFVKFPFELYKDSRQWVPPIISDEMNNFDPAKNPALENAKVTLYLAYKNHKVVGRIAVIVNWYEIKTQKIKKLRFGWFDFINDQKVSSTLLQKAYDTGKKHKLEFMEGPMGFSNMDKVGVQTEGFEHIGSMITWYNYPYYKDHLEALGFVKEKEYIESEFSFENITNPETFYKASKIISERYQLKALNFTNTKDLEPYVDQMFDVFNATYSKLSSFVAITEKQKKYFKEKYIPLINPQLVKLVADKDDNLVAFNVVMPSFSRALQKAKGRLFPFGIIPLLKARKKFDTVLFYLIGVMPEYQSKGVTAIIFKEYYDTFKKLGVTHCIQTPELTENMPIQNLWRKFDPIIFARRRTYRFELKNTFAK